MLGSLWFNSFSSGGGGDAAFELISTTVLGASAAQIDFTLSAGQQTTYKHLQLRIVHTSNAGGNGTYIRQRFNSDAGSNYAFHQLWGQGSSVLSTNATSQNANQISADSGSNSSLIADAHILDILDPFSTIKYKTTRNLVGVAGGSNAIALKSGLWMSTATVSSINLLAFSQGVASTFGAGSRFSLYGLRGA